MEFARLLELLADPRSYPHPAAPVVVHQTHISAVFLAGPYAYKVKKPRNLAFLDFSSLERRRHFCEEEVRLNRRLAPHVYRGVVPIVAADGGVRVDGEGEAFEWAVRMERLPAEATLLARLERGTLPDGCLDHLARRLARFHAEARGGEQVARGGRWSVVARNARENFEQSAGHVGHTVSAAVHARFRERTEERLAALRDRVEDRARRGVPRDTHGDLHLDHVYAFPERPPPEDLVAVDCIEFNERFRHADPVADAAFLAMDLRFRGRRDLAERFAEAYVTAADDAEGRPLWPFYEAYRAAVRGKVKGIEAAEAEVPEEERARALASARGHWLLGLGLLEVPARRPALVCVGGLPGSGKSTLARALEREAGFAVVGTDAVRKELAGLAPDAPAAAPWGEGIYAPEWDERTYAECRRRAEALLFEGRRVLVDGSFREARRRRAFAEAARAWGVPHLMLLCRTDSDRILARLASRRGGPSDADRGIYERAAAAWEPVGSDLRDRCREVPCDDANEALARALEVLGDEGLL